MQAILVTYLNPTNSRGPRLKARCAAGSLTIDYPHEYNAGEDAHRAAATALCAKLAPEGGRYWTKPLCAGQLHTGDWVFTFMDQAS